MQDSEKAKVYLDELCNVEPNRRTGSPGNRKATDFLANNINSVSMYPTSYL